MSTSIRPATVVRTGLRVVAVDPRAIDVPAAVEALGRSIGPPWQKDHKWAATAALAALATA